ncbi:MAG: hypothetical protein Q7S92_03355 [Candidatus Diapherotrites archaeon]|nr:hypothetical protein [Candidatus Diapherotrites archaeon]
MQKIHFLAIVLILILATGCTQKTIELTDQNTGTELQVQETRTENQEHEIVPGTQIQTEDLENKSIQNRLNELERVIGILIQDGLAIGEDRYAELETELNELEQEGISQEKIEELRTKLLTLKPEEYVLTTDGVTEENEIELEEKFTALKQEIDEIIANNTLVGPDHYNRMKQELDDLENQEFNLTQVSALREKLETLNPENFESPTNTSPTGQNERSQKETALLNQLPDCVGQKFTEPIVNLSNLMEIERLGAIGPPGHTTPTEHMYFHIFAGRTTTNTVPLLAPGEIYIYEISSGFDDLGQIQEYTIRFGVCKELLGYFNHVKGISDTIKNANETAPCRYSDQNLPNCTKDLFYKANAREEIGRVGHMQGNFDFGVLDYATKNEFANPVRYGDDIEGLYRPRSFYAQCPLDYYENSVKTQLYSKVIGTGEPKCGQIMQDILGTLQGNWFNGADSFSYNNWEKQLAFVNDNRDAAQNVISVGGTFKEASEWIFSPQNSGTINRKFSEVRADGQIYCYDQGGTGKILVQMISDTELNIEYKTGSCTPAEAFQNPIKYNR